MPYKYIKWYHWLWLWVLPTETASDYGKYQTTTVVFKQFKGVMYVIDTKYAFHKSKKRRKK